jgi:hypothetical protein
MPKVKKLGAQFITQLRRESADHKADRAGAQEFMDESMPESARKQALKDSNYISEAAAKLANPATNAHDRADALTKVMNSAESISLGLHDKTCAPGKDQKAAEAESAVIQADVKALRGANLTPEQKSQLVGDIASKAGLIKNELNDSPTEKSEIQHDNAAILSGAKLEATLRYAMANPGRASKALEQIKSELNGLNNGEGTGVLEAVKIDRQQDMVTESIYMAANSADNAQNNSKIIEFTNPYAPSARR